MNDISDQARTVAGPTPRQRRQPDASALINRPASAPNGTPSADLTRMVGAPPERMTSQVTSPELLEARSDLETPSLEYVSPSPEQQTRVPEPNAPTKAKISALVPTELRDRFRAMFHYTAGIEGDQSMSDLLERLLEAECRRRETEYNGGQPFTGGQIPLLRGRRPRP